MKAWRQTLLKYTLNDINQEIKIQLNKNNNNSNETFNQVKQEILNSKINISRRIINFWKEIVFL